MLLLGLLGYVSFLNGEPAKSPDSTNHIEKLSSSFGANTKKYPKIGANLADVPWIEVERCIKRIKEDRLGDVVGLFGVGFGSKVPCTNTAQILKNAQALCKKERLYFHTGEIFYDKKTMEEFKKAGEFYLGTEDGEFGQAGKDSRKVNNMQEALEKLLGIMRKRYDKFKDSGVPMIFNVEIGPAGHAESLEAGADVCLSENVLNIARSISSARGASKAYEKPLWGAWLNVEFYAKGGSGYGPPLDDSYTPAHQRRLMQDYNMSYIYGADVIILQDCLFKIDIAHWIWEHLGNATNSAAPPSYDAETPQCKGFREVAKRFYSYVQTHPRSDQEPEVDIGLVRGNLDGSRYFGEGVMWGQGVIWGQTGDYWKPTIEEGWKIQDILFLSGKLNYRYEGTPYGQVDIVPIRAPINVLRKYKVLIFPGWNTMTPEIYAKLREYVKNGGVLFMSLPQLSQQIDRKPELELINNGDFRDLFGVTVKGKCERKGDVKIGNVVKFDRDSSIESFKFPVGNTFIYKTNGLSALEFADMKLGGAKVLASVNDGKIPVLVENKVGKGVAYLMTCYSLSPVPVEFVRPLVEATVKAGDFELMGEMSEKKDINYAVYRGRDENEETKILLVNIDWTEADNVKNIKLRIKDMVMPVAVKEGAIKTINVLGNLALTACDDAGHYLYLCREKRDNGEYTGKVSGRGVCVIKGIMRGNKAPQKVTLDGKAIYFKYDHSSCLLTAECNLWGEHVLKICGN